MNLGLGEFAFVISVAGLINGLGIARWVLGLAEYLRRRERVEVQHYWVFHLFASAHFLMHILLWWSLWGIQDAERFNFLSYVFLLTGPILMYLGTSLLTPSFDEDTVRLRDDYFSVRPAYFTTLTLQWLWALSLSPVLRGDLAATAPIWLGFLGIAIALRISRAPAVHAVGAVLNWLLIAGFIGLFSLELGGVGPGVD